ncbi:MAG: methionyl-tRNA formyltransferase [Nocardioides sp.]
MRLVFAGTPEAALPSLEMLASSGHEVVGVVTRPDAAAGRGRRLEASPVARRAVDLGIPVLKPDRPGDSVFQDRLRDLAPDCCPVVAYGALLPESALAIPRRGWINLHFSSLPAWRGAAPVQHAIRAGDQVTGATVFRIVRELDAGPIFGVMTERIRPEDTAGTLLSRLAQAGAGLLASVLDGIEEGALEARPQSGDGVSLAPKITTEDALVAWARPAEEIDRLIRSCTPAPGAWTRYEGGRLKLGPVAPMTTPHQRDLGPGEFFVEKSRVLVGTGSLPVRLGDVQAVGKRMMPAADWTRGLRDSSDRAFEATPDA